MSKAESAKFAKTFEEKIGKVLKEMTLNSCSNSYRYPDQRSTRGGFSNKQPADYFVLINGKFFNLECKTSVVEAHFPKVFKGLISDHQMTSARKTNRALGRYYFLFMSKFSNMVEVWDSRDLFEPFSTPRMTLKSFPVALLDIKAGYNEWHSELLRVSLK
jgi:penicillin-binding protein-related factor A (putative recombinase)